MNDKSKKRFEFLKSLYYAAPLSEPLFAELKQLAKKYDRKMSKFLETSPLA